MKIVFSDHALQQASERRLSKIEIERAIRKPQKLIQQSSRRYRALKTVHRNKKRYLLVVIYDLRNSTREVVTAFLTTKLKKYL